MPGKPPTSGKAHPSGRPIRAPERRDYGMRAWRRTEHVNPRLNPPPIPRITGATDLYGIGFLTRPPEDQMWWETRGRRR